MHLHTRLLLGIAAITLLALAVSVLVPLRSVRGDVARETASSMQLAGLLLRVQQGIDAAPDAAAARAAAAAAVRQAMPLRHVRIVLTDGEERALAASPSDRQAGSLASTLVAGGSGAGVSYPLSYRGALLGALRVLPNPLSETLEIEQRAAIDLVLLTATILAMAASIYWMVRSGLQPVRQIQAALGALEAGALDVRLPHYRLKDLDEISYRFNRCAAAMGEAAAQRRAMTRRLIEVQEDERRRLARELHDELGQSLTAIKLDAAYIARETAAEGPQIAACAAGIGKLTSEVMELIRGMLARLRPHGLETMGLRATLQELVAGWQARVAGKLHCTLTFAGPVNALPADLNVTLYRLVQECLTNAVRHSRARRVAVHLSADGGPDEALPARVSLEVRESEIEATGDPQPGTGGSGLLGMRERVEAHGGELRIEQQSGGMSVAAWMPIERRAVEAAHG
jgi:two-component system sensor histidine kinase UhpB